LILVPHIFDISQKECEAQHVMSPSEHFEVLTLQFSPGKGFMISEAHIVKDLGQILILRE